MKNFTLVNPYIKGTFDTNFKGKSELEAAQKTWASLGKNITQNLPKYCFTLERSSDKKLFHFSVKEEVNDGVVDYKLGSIKVNAKSKKLKAFKNKLKELKNADKKHQDGGKRKKKKDDDSPSDSESSDYNVFSKKYKKHLKRAWGMYPISWYWYDPLVYDTDVFLPTIVGSPYVHLSLLESYDPMAWWNMMYF